MITLDQLQGHWIRGWIKAPGFEDRTTRVHWMQCGAAYADVRIPAERPDTSGIACLADLPAEALAQLAGSEGFAGTVTLEDAHCTWQRDINWHGTPEATDIGHIAFDAQGKMIETGVHADYTELWDNENPDAKSAYALTGEGYAGTLVIIGTRCVLALDTRGRRATGSVVRQLQDATIPPETAQLFNKIYALGTFRDGVVQADLATQPKSEGGVVLTLRDGRATWHRTDFYGSQTDVSLTIESLPSSSQRPFRSHSAS